MKAWQLTAPTGVDALELTDLAEPRASPSTVLVRVRAASLNYRDLMVASGRYGARVPLPLIPLALVMKEDHLRRIARPEGRLMFVLGTIQVMGYAHVAQHVLGPGLGSSENKCAGNKSIRPRKPTWARSNVQSWAKFRGITA